MSNAIHNFYRITGLFSRFLCSWAIVAKTPAACSPPITEIRALGHMYKNLGLTKYKTVIYDMHYSQEDVQIKPIGPSTHSVISGAVRAPYNNSELGHLGTRNGCD
jgi:hypothetical protein